jgi:mxaJ protein
MNAARGAPVALALFAVCLIAAAPRDVGTSHPRSGEQEVIRIAADPNNLPFSDANSRGFENRIAELLARELGVTIEYAWRAQRRGFFRAAFREDTCDIVLGVPAGFERARTTRPYYRSSYVFVTLASRPRVRSLEDPWLRSARVAVQLVGDEGCNTPPAHALARRGIVRNVTGYTLYGDYRDPNPPARILDAVASGAVDVAIVWGPLAGWYAKHATVPLRIEPVEPLEDGGIPLAFGISVGVRPDRDELRERVDAALESRRAEVNRILDDYGVPRVSAPAGVGGQEDP